MFKIFSCCYVLECLMRLEEVLCVGEKDVTWCERDPNSES